MRNTEKPPVILSDLYDGTDGTPLTPAEFLHTLGTFKTAAGTFSKWKHSPGSPDDTAEANGKQPQNKNK